MQTMSSPKGVQNNHMTIYSCQSCKTTNHTTPELSGTFRNPPPGPTPPHTGTFRNLPPEPTPAHAAKTLAVSPTAIDLFAVFAMFDYMGTILFAKKFCPCKRCHRQKVFKTITWLLLSRPQSNKPHRNSSKFSGTTTHRNLPEPVAGTYTSTRRNLPPEPTAAHAGTLQNPPELSGPCLRNLHHHEPASGTHSSMRRNSPEPSGTFRALPSEPTPARAGTCLRNPHKLFGTFRNLPPEPAPATRAGAHRNLSGLKTTLACAVGEKAVDDQSLCIRKQLTTKIIRIANQLTTARI